MTPTKMLTAQAIAKLQTVHQKIRKGRLMVMERPRSRSPVTLQKPVQVIRKSQVMVIHVPGSQRQTVSRRIRKGLRHNNLLPARVSLLTVQMRICLMT